MSFKVRGPEFWEAAGYTITGTQNEIIRGNNFSKVWRADGPAGNVVFQAEVKDNTLTYTMSGELDSSKSGHRLGIGRSQIDDIAYFPRINDPHLKVNIAYDFNVSFEGKVLPQKISGSQQVEYPNDISGDGQVGPFRLHASHEYSKNHQQVLNTERSFQYQNDTILTRAKDGIGGNEIILPIQSDDFADEKKYVDDTLFRVSVWRVLEAIYQKDKSAIKQRLGENNAGNFEDVRKAYLTIFNGAYSQGKLTFFGKVTIHVNYPAVSQTADLKIASLDMVGPHTLRVNLKGETAKRRDPVKITTNINGRPIEFIAKPSDLPAFEAAAKGADAAIEVDFERWNVPRFNDDVRFSVTASVPETQVSDTKATGLRLPILFVPGIDPPGGVIGDGRYPGFDNLMKRLVVESRKLDDYFPYSPEFLDYGKVTSNTYITMFGVDYLRNKASFYAAAQYLNDQWLHTYRRKCWADKFNIVAHSKGTLVTRAAMSNPYLETYNKAKKVMLIQGPHMGSLSPIFGIEILGVHVGPISLYIWSEYKMLNPVWLWQSPDGKVFSVPPTYYNPELLALNKRLMNPKPLYKVVYSVRRDSTDWKHVGKLHIGLASGIIQNPQGLSKTYGDEIVPTFSQRGQIFNASPGANYTPTASYPRILPFADLQKRGRLSEASITETHRTMEEDPEIVNILLKFFNQP